jgi:hypothetical protein
MTIRDSPERAILDTSVVIAADLAPIPGVVDDGRQPRLRAMDLLVAATAHAQGARLDTRNIDDFTGLEGLVGVTAV